MDLSRRGLLVGILAAACAPVIIRTEGLIMPIKPSLVATPRVGFMQIYIDRLTGELVLADGSPVPATMLESTERQVAREARARMRAQNETIEHRSY